MQLYSVLINVFFIFLNYISVYNPIFSFRIKTGFNCQNNKTFPSRSFVATDEESNYMPTDARRGDI